MNDLQSIIVGEIFKKVLEVVKRPEIPVQGPIAEDTVAKAVTEEIAPVVLNQTNNESPWKSRVLRGAALALGGLAAGYFGLQVADGDIESGVKAVTDVVTALGVLYTIYGRLTSKGTPKI